QDRLETVKILLQSGASLEAKDSQGKSPLHIAARHYSAVVELLLQHGADVHALDDDDTTPLIYAAIYCKHQIIKQLIDKGAKVNQATKEKKCTALHYTALHYSVMKDDNITEQDMLETVKILLDNGADLEAKNSEGSSALHRAAEHSSALVKILIERGAKVNAQNNEGDSPMMCAVLEWEKSDQTETIQAV